MRKPSEDSWKYILRYLPKSCKHVKSFTQWLEENKPLFWVADAFRLSEQVKKRKVKRICREDIPLTVQPELISELIIYLQTINDWYNERRRKEMERQARLKQEYLKIPLEERKRIAFINQMAPKKLWPLKNCPEEIKLHERLKTIEFIKLNQVIEWLNLSEGERASWLNETIRLLEIVKPKVDAEEEAVMQEAERMFRKWEKDFKHRYEFTFNPKTNINSAYNVLGLNVGASVHEIKSAFRLLVKKHHPDAGGRKEDFIKIREAYEILTETN